MICRMESGDYLEVATSRPGKHEFAINEDVIIRVHYLGSPGGDRLAPFLLGETVVSQLDVAKDLDCRSVHWLMRNAPPIRRN